MSAVNRPVVASVVNLMFWSRLDGSRVVAVAATSRVTFSIVHFPVRRCY